MSKEYLLILMKLLVNRNICKYYHLDNILTMMGVTKRYSTSDIARKCINKGFIKEKKYSYEVLTMGKEFVNENDIIGIISFCLKEGLDLNEVQKWIKN